MGVGVGVHLHASRVDRRVDNNPRATADLAVWGDVDNDGLVVLGELVDDEGAELEHLLEHILAAAREAAPVCEDDKGEALARVEVLDGLGCLVGRVGEPHLAGLHLLLRLRLEVGGVGEDGLVDQPVLSDDYTDGHAAEAPTADNDRLRPVPEGLDERARIEEAGRPLAVALEQLARVEWRSRGRVVRDGSLDRVDDRQARAGAADLSRHEGDPFHDLVDGVQVGVDEEVRHAVTTHHLRPAELQVGLVHVGAEQLVERLEDGEEEGGI